MAPEYVCLDIAIDHRIRSLIEPVDYLLRDENGDAPSILHAEGARRRLPSPETAVTKQLAGHAAKGGIAVVLQQPRSGHPFERGAQAVVDDCDTLRALQNVFSVMSGGMLDLLRDISVVDLLPFVTDEDWDALSGDNNENQAEKERAFRTSQWVLAAKEPDVVLCAGRKFLPWKLRGLKGDMWKLECKGVGEVFPKKYPWVQIKDRAGNRVKVLPVNGFHPSCAVNHMVEHSCLRQLLCLVVLETCLVYKGVLWREEDWMADLRERCKGLCGSRGEVFTIMVVLPYCSRDNC
jgi:hypothetical protein